MSSLSSADLIACDDLSLLTRNDLERLVRILREELDLAQAQEVLARNEVEIKAERKARSKGAR